MRSHPEEWKRWVIAQEGGPSSVAQKFYQKFGTPLDRNTVTRWKKKFGKISLIQNYGTEEELRKHFSSRTIEEVAEYHGVTIQAIRNAEVRFGVRCLRECGRCGAKKRFHEVHRRRNKSQVFAFLCNPCKEDVQSEQRYSKADQQTAEFDEVPRLFYDMTKKPLCTFRHKTFDTTLGPTTYLVQPNGIPNI